MKNKNQKFTKKLFFKNQQTNKLTLKFQLPKYLASNQATSFTLIELLVVIAIIALLAVLAIPTFNSARIKARDARRVADLNQLSKALELYYLTNGFYPNGDIGSESSAGFCIEKATDPGKFQALMSSFINLTNFRDPRYNPNQTNPEWCYWYQTASFGQQYKLSARIETSNYASTIQDGGIDPNTFEVYSGSNANSLGGWVLVSKNSNNAYYFDRLGSNLNGRTGFYVMQYEAKYDKSGDGKGDDATTYSCIADSGDGWDWRDSGCSTGGTVVSSPEGSPIVHITHNQALSACPPGSHLITNDEWMAIARDAEKVASNWYGGVVGNNCLYRGNTGETTNCSYNGSGPEKGSGRNSKAKLTLSNGSEIWDIAGNVGEHVKNCGTTANCTTDTLISLQDNPEATTDGVNPITDADFNGSDFASGGGLSRYLLLTSPSYYGDLDNDGDSDNDDKKVFRPSNDSYSAAQGMGRILHYSNSSNTTDSYVFVRSGCWLDGTWAGAFTLYLSWGTNVQAGGVGFRCAR